MKKQDFDTLSTAVDALTNNGFKESFKAEEKCIRGLYSKKAYQPNELKIVDSYRFEGMTNPADSMELYAIEAEDGQKGTLVMAYGAEHSQNVELIKKVDTE